MLIEFKIHLDDNGEVSVVHADSKGNPNLPPQKHLASAFPHSTGHGSSAKMHEGGSVPLADTGTGKPHGERISSGAGPVIVIGPIVICGSGMGHTHGGGSVPLADTGTGKQ